MNQDVNGNRKLFWKEVSEANGELQQNKGWNWEVGTGRGEVRKIWKNYFEDLHNIDTQEQFAVNMYGFDGILRGNYFGGEPVRRAEVEVRVGKLKNG